MRQTLGLLILLVCCACASGPTGESEAPSRSFRVALWMHGKGTWSDAEWQAEFARLREAGFSDLFIGAGPEELRRMVRLGGEQEMRIHGWIWTLNRPGDKVAQEHPDWYAVNRKGQNSLEYRAYVNYYQWLSPFSAGAREHVKRNIAAVAEVEGLASVHLDYVRYCDVILATGLQPKYGLVQDHEMPEYDFGYHPEARRLFEEKFGVDPMMMPNPQLSNEWRQFRLNAVTDLVNELVLIAHAKGTKISAAVFPFPEMSRQMVRQDWDKWKLDLFLPMIYHNFYEKDVEWIGFCTRQGVRDLDGRAELLSGLYLPALSADELEAAVRASLANGAAGVSLFDRNSLTDEKLARIEKLVAEPRR